MTKTEQTTIEQVTGDKAPAPKAKVAKVDKIEVKGIAYTVEAEDFRTKLKKKEVYVRIPHLNPAMEDIALSVQFQKRGSRQGQFKYDALKHFVDAGVREFEVNIVLSLREFVSKDTGKTETSVRMDMVPPFGSKDGNPYRMSVVDKNDKVSLLAVGRERLNVTEDKGDK